jgi:hypothetical protein
MPIVCDIFAYRHRDWRQLKPYPDDHVVHYLTTEEEVNQALAHIREGAIGFDTEYVSCKPSEEESFIEEIFNNVPGNKRSGIIVWQAIQKKYGMGFLIEWENIGLCIVQIPGETMYGY